MAREIERKFLLANDDWEALAPQVLYRQGYLSSDRERTVRVRTAQQRGTLTVKGITVGMARTEFEYDIPFEDASQMLDQLCERPLIEKYRSRIVIGEFTWEVDQFLGDNAGLVLAEVELADETQRPELPPWVGEEVTGDPRYFNANLVRNPYARWPR